MNIEHPPAMHIVLGWHWHRYIHQIVRLISHRLQGIAGRTNIGNQIKLTLRLIDFYDQRTAKIKNTDLLPALVATSAEQAHSVLFYNW